MEILNILLTPGIVVSMLAVALYFILILSDLTLYRLLWAMPMPTLASLVGAGIVYKDLLQTFPSLQGNATMAILLIVLVLLLAPLLLAVVVLRFKD